MKVNEVKITNPIILNSSFDGLSKKTDERACSVGSEALAVEANSSECISQYAKAQVLMQNGVTISTPRTQEDIIKLLTNIVKQDGMGVAFCHKKGNSIVANIGRPFEGMFGFFHDDARAKCLMGEDGCLKEIYILDNSNNSVKIYGADGNLEKNFSSSDMKALKEYKYSPNSFHGYLRYGKQSFLPPQKDLESFINTIDNIFDDETKIWNAQTPMVVYRALQSNLTQEQIDALSHVGGIFEDSSFVSTTLKADTAKRFQHRNPILEIELPENSKYIKLDELFNIDKSHWQEQELLLNRNSKFQVTGFEPENNIIKVRYLQP